MKAHAENILSFKELDFDFRSQSLCCVLGIGPGGSSNGSGKSNFFDVLKLGLYGKNSKGLDKASIIRKGCKEGKIIVYWQHGEEERRVIRHFRPAESLTLLVNGVDLKIPLLVEAQKKVDEWLGHDCELFEAVVMYSQEQTEFFVNADESSKKGLLEKIQGFQRYTKAQALAKQKESALVSEIASINTNLATLSGKVIAAEESISHLNERLAVEEEERTTKKAELTTQLKAIKLQDVQKLQACKEELEAQVLESRAGTKQAMALLTQLQEVQSDIKELEGKKQVERNGKVRAEAKLTAAKTKKDNNCPTCGRAYDPASLKQTRDNMQVDIDNIQAEIQKYDDQIAPLQQRATDIKAQYKPLQVTLTTLEAVENQLQTVKEKIDSRNEENTKRRAEFKLLKSKIEALNQPTTTAEELRRQQGILSAEIANQAEVTVTLNTKTTELSHVRFWVTGFGNQGIKSLLLDSCAGFINQRINYYLSDITDGSVKAKFSTQKALKTGELRDKIEFKVTIDGQEFDYKAYSGGQKTVINFSTMLALRDLAAQERTLIPILVLDETFRELDDRFSNAIHGLLKKLSRSNSIYVVSHTEGLRDWIPDYITVMMDKTRTSRLVV